MAFLANLGPYIIFAAYFISPNNGRENIFTLHHPPFLTAISAGVSLPAPRLVLKPHIQQIVNFILISDIRLLVIGSDLEQFMLHFLNGFIQVFIEEGDMVGPDLERRINEVRFHPLVALGG